jgi:hypothetical protein
MNHGSKIFMLVGSVAILLLIGLPLLFVPMAWGRRLGWKIPEESDFANYLGRSLGGVAVSIAILGFKAAQDPWRYQAVFGLLIFIGILMTAVHLYGFIKKTQPKIENVEVFIYPLISLLAWWLYPQQP